MTPIETKIWWDGLLIGQAISSVVWMLVVLAMYFAHRRETRVLRQFKAESADEINKQLLEACVVTMQYWWACAHSGADRDEEDRHPGCHLSLDTPKLQAMCNKAAELGAKAVQDAGVTVLHGWPIKQMDLGARDDT